MRLICKLLGHRRDRKTARRRGHDEYLSNCRFCGEQMKRVSGGEWEVSPHLPESSQEA